MEEEIEVTPSEESGNVPAEAPSEQPIVETEAETPVEVDPAQPAEPKEPELFELPDGRKVDAQGVAQEYKNLLSDYTKKSQTLAEIEKAKPIINPTPENPLADPNYTPQTYDELAQQIEARTLARIEAKEQAKVDQRNAIENAVISQLTEIKTVDPNVNENALFLHANKYGFRDLKLAHQNMKDMSEMAKKVQTTTAANIAKRNDAVSVTPGAIGARPDPGQFENALGFLRSLK